MKGECERMRKKQRRVKERKKQKKVAHYSEGLEFEPGISLP
jgi:hypothetical protein